MSKWIDIRGPILADTVYCDNNLVAKDVGFTIPGASFMSAEIKAMGTMSVPLVGLLEHMELKITKVGVDIGLAKMSKLEKQNFEFRWVQNVSKADGSQSSEGCKAFIRTMPGNFPSIGIEVGNASENEMTYGVTRVQIFVGGKEILCIDRLSQILRINGKDYMSDINSLL